MYVDTHSHLNFHSFRDDFNDVLSRAHQQKVTKMMVPGFTLASSQDAVRIAEEHPSCFAAAGIHPNDAQEWTPQTEASLRTLLGKPEVYAVGEIGLDYYRDHAPHNLQTIALQAQLALAEEFNKPVIIHIRESIKDTFAVLFAWQQSLLKHSHPLAQHPGIFHAFPGTIEEARLAVDHGFKIGIGGPVTFKNAHQKHKLTEQLPLEAIVLETDAPFLTPHPHRGKRNEPSFIPLIAEKIAALKGMPLEEVSQMTTENASAVFRW